MVSLDHSNSFISDTTALWRDSAQIRSVETHTDTQNMTNQKRRKHLHSATIVMTDTILQLQSMLKFSFEHKRWSINNRFVD
jgi:hypothetical protein